jgi:hypothetical protein
MTNTISSHDAQWPLRPVISIATYTDIAKVSLTKLSHLLGEHFVDYILDRTRGTTLLPRDFFRVLSLSHSLATYTQSWRRLVLTSFCRLPSHAMTAPFFKLWHTRRAQQQLLYTTTRNKYTRTEVSRRVYYRYYISQRWIIYSSVCCQFGFYGCNCLVMLFNARPVSDSCTDGHGYRLQMV